MNLHLQMLSHSGKISDALTRDGWKLEGRCDDILRATHPEVPDEESARTRLNRLGLLTSRCLRLDFRYSPD